MRVWRKTKTDVASLALAYPPERERARGWGEGAPECNGPLRWIRLLRIYRDDMGLMGLNRIDPIRLRVAVCWTWEFAV